MDIINRYFKDNNPIRNFDELKEHPANSGADFFWVSNIENNQGLSCAKVMFNYASLLLKIVFRFSCQLPLRSSFLTVLCIILSCTGVDLTILQSEIFCNPAFSLLFHTGWRNQTKAQPILAVACTEFGNRTYILV